MKPHWLIKKTASVTQIHSIKTRLRGHNLHTVCEEARCPNLGECFSHGTATFLILGDVCTRSCGFCGVRNIAGSDPVAPPAPDPNEPTRIAKMVMDLGLNYVVITSVTRDDLPDEGAGQFAEVVKELKHEAGNMKYETQKAGFSDHPPTSAQGGLRRASRSPITDHWSLLSASSSLVVELLTPDFHVRPDCLTTICDTGPDVFAHNVETVRKLTPVVRSKADYDRSLAVLRWVRTNYPSITLKSGFMLGLGESRQEVLETLRDLCNVGCDIVTIGQYLRPTSRNLPVVEYIRPEVFEEYRELGEGLGIKHVVSGPFVRSSYHADLTRIGNADQTRLRKSFGGQARI